MPRNGSGTYTPPGNGWYPPVNGTPATAADWLAIINDLASAMSQSLSRDGQTTVTNNLPMGGNKLTGLAAGTATGDSLRYQQLFSQGQPQDLASAATTDIGSSLTTVLNITGSSTISSFGANYNGPRFIRFAGACTLTNSPTLVVPGGANLVTSANDCAIVIPLGNPASGWRIVAYQKADGSAISAGVSPGSITTSGLTQNTEKILGRTTASSGSIEELSVGAGLLLASGALSSVFSSAAENSAGLVENKSVDPLGIREAFNATGSAPVYACRAWVNFNGNGTIAIRASGNVTSITDNGPGAYTVNFTTPLPDTNFSAVVSCGGTAGVSQARTYDEAISRTTSTVGIGIITGNGASFADAVHVQVAVFR